MKSLQMFLAVVFAAALVVPTAMAGTEESVIEVEGMSCESGAYQLQAALKKLDGVQDATVSLALNEAVVTHDPGQVSRAALVKAINGLGFQASAKSATNSDSNGGESTVASGPQASSSCSKPAESVATDNNGGLSDEQIAVVADYIVQSIVSDGLNPDVAFTEEQIEEATGIVIPPQDSTRIQKAARAKLQEYPEVLAKLASSPSRCADYDACSLHGDLSGATGETLDMYEREKKEDGFTFDDRPLPAFEAFDIGLQQVRSDDLRGKPAVLAFLAGHCTHSIDTFPILQEMTRTYGPEGLQVVGVVVNSGTPDDVASWVSEFEPEYDVWVYENASLGDIIGSHLVPTYLFVDANGQVKEKLVGYKESKVVNDWLAKMLAAETRISRR